VASARAPARWWATPRRAACLDLRALTGAVLLASLLATVDAPAQVSGSVSAVSNYRYRGVSLSHNDPAAQAALVYDDPRGFYAGAFGSSVKIGQDPTNEAQGIFFAGYAHTFAAGGTLEAGVTYTGFTGSPSYAYPEVLVGATLEKLSARLHYSPNYYGRGYDAVYGEIDAAHRVYEHVQVVAHGGALWTNARDVYGNAVDTIYDARIGVVFDFDQFNVQVSWVGINQSYTGYGLTGVRSRNGPVASISWLF
jgi:uncharacterized protein (TIGR02001 family)